MALIFERMECNTYAEAYIFSGHIDVTQKEGSLDTGEKRKFPTMGQVIPAKSITLSGIRPEAKQYLEKHGCTLKEGKESVTVFYAEGATKQEIYPRTMSERFLVQLPDGTQLLEIYSLHIYDGTYLYLLEHPEGSQ